jgi:hypothetical protein
MSSEAVARRALAARPRPAPRFTSGGLYNFFNGVNKAFAASVFAIPDSDTVVLAAGSDPVFSLNTAGNWELKYNGWPQQMRVKIGGMLIRTTGTTPSSAFLMFVGTGKRNGSIPINGDQQEIVFSPTIYRALFGYQFYHSTLYNVVDGDIISPLMAPFLNPFTARITSGFMWCETVKDVTA